MNPQHVIDALRRIETELHALVAPVDEAVYAVRRAVEQQQRSIDIVRIPIERKLAAAHDQLERCLNRPRGENGEAPDCRHHEMVVEKYEVMLNEVRRAQRLLDDAAHRFEVQASGAIELTQKVIPAAAHWLHEREDALTMFERTSDDADMGRMRFDSGVAQSAEQNQRNSAAITVAEVTAYMTLINAIAAMGGGGHGPLYQNARQQFLYSLASDPDQPKYVRGWIKQELNRLKQVQRAKAEGRAAPGGNKRRIRGIPGLDVGHFYPDIDLSENFRLELASMNRARPGIARRLGITSRR